jgi:hypothetical protein
MEFKRGDRVIVNPGGDPKYTPYNGVILGGPFRVNPIGYWYEVMDENGAKSKINLRKIRLDKGWYRDQKINSILE